MAALLVLTLAFAGSASAATYTPNTTADGAANGSDCPAAPATPAAGACSLRDAVAAANSTESDDEIVLEGKRYELNPEFETLPIFPAPSSGTLLIRGTNARETIIDGNSGAEIGIRPITFRPNAKGELRDLAITGGNGVSFNCPEDGECVVPDSDREGGGLAILDTHGDGDNDADALLTRVRVFDNGVDFDGGGIVNKGKLTLVQSLVDGNVAGQDGGGIENDDELTLTNSTVSGNETKGNAPLLRGLRPVAEGNGGGIDNDGDSPENFGTFLQNQDIPEDHAFLEVNNSTIADNTAAGNGGGVYTFVNPCVQNPSACQQTLTETGGPISHFHNSLVTDNTADGGANCVGNQPAGSGDFTSSEGHNMEDGDTCQFTAAGDLNRKSDIEPLAGNGGPTNTHALKNVSAAVDAAEANGCPANDQRGITRPQRSACDIGAFEREPEPVQEQPQQEQPQQQLPQQETPEARGPRCLDTQPPLTDLDRDGLRVTEDSVTLSGTSRDRGQPCASGVQRVEVSMAKVSGTDLNCRFLRRSNRFLLSAFTNCRQPILFIADGTTQWQFKFRVKLKPGKYRAQARGYDEVRNKETPKKRQNIVVFTVK